MYFITLVNFNLNITEITVPLLQSYKILTLKEKCFHKFTVSIKSVVSGFSTAAYLHAAS